MLVLALLALPLLSTASVHGRHSAHAHSHTASKRLPTTWHHDSDHPVHSLFRRADTAVSFAAVGSDEWAAGYPAGPPASPDVSTLPAAWVAALNDAISRKVIPDVPLSNNASDGGSPTYPNGADPNSPDICSATYQCRLPGDIWDGPAGTIGISFDDGPEAGTADLLGFLGEKNQRVTHFLIGSNILFMPDAFTKMFNMGDDIAVHTWTHPHMTTQSNLQVVAELGYTMQLIHNSTGGRVPKFWRPPYGDTDKRVSAIAKEVFGLTTIIWNQDTSDWSLTETPPGTTSDAIAKNMQTWLTGPKSPGLIILEHELTKESTASFVAAYPVMQQNGWNLVSLAALVGGNVTYQNAASNTAAVTNVDIVNAKNGAVAAVGAAGAAGSSASASGASAKSAGAAATPAGAKTAAGSGTSASSSPSSTPSTPRSAAPRWTTGPTTLLSAAVLFMLWK
ncbi:carbohydrate esterase family 4 protein [Mycena olivaceomarginata]|nr:carbohydrate esterase family 4 protein [Mycena olivaceomarginata]